MELTKCDYCKSVIQYDESDIQMGGTLNDMLAYITCPCCGEMIVVGYARNFS